MAVFTTREIDLEMAEHYRDFLPRKIFDAHTHLHCAGTIPSFFGANDAFLRREGTPDAYLEDMRVMLPSIDDVSLNMMPMPDPAMNALDNGLRDRANAHVVRLQNARPDCAASVYVSPMDTEDTIDALAAQDGVRALKCYCYSAGQADVTQLPVDAFLTEAMWRVANGRGLAIVLHLMRTNALSDQGNFAYVTRMARKYPNAQLVLAHCAAGFAGWTLLEKIRELEDAGNIWFDLAAVCESAPMMACILKNAGKRAMWGSDYPICMHRGRSIALAGRETWLMDNAVSGLEKTYIGIENLTALYHASLVMNLDATQVQDLFYGNAARLFGVIAEKRIS